MESVEISIIVPIYNVEKYLEKCIDSLINQTFRDIEIILVNDGSTDSSKKICECYAEKDNRIILVNQKNKGQSAARNLGISMANGKYIGFVDGDDYVKLNMYETLHKKLLEYNVDIIGCQMERVTKDNKILFRTSNVLEYGKNESGAEAIIRYLKGDVWSLCDKLYKKEYIKRIKFVEGMTCGEDYLCIIPILREVKKIIILNDPLYKYVFREESTTTKAFNIKSFDIPKVWNIVKENAKENEEDFKKLADIRCFYSSIDLINSYLRENINIYEKEILNVIENLRGYNSKFLRENNILKRYQIARNLIVENYKVYKFIFRIINLKERRK